MRLEKRMKMELRDITAKKKDALEELNTLLVEVDLLREEKVSLMREIEKSQEDSNKILNNQIQKVRTLEHEYDSLNKIILESKCTIERLGLLKTELEITTDYLKTSVSGLEELKKKAEKEADISASKLEKILSDIKTAEADKYVLTVAFRELHDEIVVEEKRLSDLKKEIKSKEDELSAIRREQSDHSNWSQYLIDKEGFLKEQFGLLGVKYVMYNN